MANMRKVIAKNRNIKEEKDNNSSPNIVKITLIVGLIMISLAYGVSALIYHFTKQPSTITEVKQYNINSSVVFDIKEDEYYVLFYDKTGADAVVLNAIVDKYRKSNKNTLYVVDLSKEYNKQIISDTPNQNASSSSELRIASSTLIKIKDGKNSGYYENVLLIENELK